MITKDNIPTEIEILQDIIDNTKQRTEAEQKKVIQFVIRRITQYRNIIRKLTDDDILMEEEQKLMEEEGLL